MLETRRRLVDRPCRNHATTDSEPKPARNQTRRELLTRWHEVTFDKPDEGQAKRERLTKAIENSKSIAQLAGNPLLLTMMAILKRNQKLPDDRVDLYQQCSRLLLHQWDVERTLGEFPGLSAEIGLREKTDILRTVAYSMQTRLSDKSRANYIDGTTLTSLIEDYLHTELRFEQARAEARALVEQLRTRNFILCYLGADSYAFVHRTFLEYFCAADIVHQFNVAKTLSEQDLIALFDAHCRDDDWREVLRLICGQIDEQFVGRIVEHLATRTDLEKWDGQESLPELPLAILILSEVRSVNRLDEAGVELAKSVFTAISKGGTEPFHQDLLGAAATLGAGWPSIREVESSTAWVIEKLEAMEGYYAAIYWPRIAAELGMNRQFVLSLVQSENQSLRCGALQALAEKWPDETTRELLAQRTVQDDHESPRRAALQALAEKRPDETTRELLAQRAVQDDHYDPRRAALQALAEKWPDETTRELLAGWAVQDDDKTTRGEACSALGKMHSEFGRILPTKDLDGVRPFLDPREPIPREHIERAAEQAGIAAEDVDAAVESLSAFLGWDVTRGARASIEDSPEE